MHLLDAELLTGTIKKLHYHCRMFSDFHNRLLVKNCRNHAMLFFFAVL